MKGETALVRCVQIGKRRKGKSDCGDLLGLGRHVSAQTLLSKDFGSS